MAWWRYVFLYHLMDADGECLTFTECAHTHFLMWQQRVYTQTCNGSLCLTFTECAHTHFLMWQQRVYTQTCNGSLCLTFTECAHTHFLMWQQRVYTQTCNGSLHKHQQNSKINVTANGGIQLQETKMWTYIQGGNTKYTITVVRNWCHPRFCTKTE